MTSDFPAPAFIDAKDVRFAVYERDGDPARERPPVLFIHGWPELAYSWRNQLAPVAEAGFRAIAFDLKGFGRSSAPEDPAKYSIHLLTDEIAALLDALSVEKAIVVGHDWGGAIAWPFAQLHGARVVAVASVCTPHRPPPPVSPLSIIERRFGPDHYFITFQKPGVAEKTFATDPERFFRLLFRKPVDPARARKLGPRLYDILGRFKNAPVPPKDDLVMAEADLNHYVEAYKRAGFHGGVNLYRNIDVNWEIMKSVDPKIEHPALWVGATADFFLPPDSADGMEELVPKLEKRMIEDCGHWVTWEKPDALNEILIDWLLRQMPR
ncbi:MAG: alpha/beta hydrolase [Pseudomonadota bacterium]